MKKSRVSRVMQMLTTLQSGRPRKAEELSRLLGISRRTLYRDLKELEHIGVTPHFSPDHQGYRLKREQLLPPVNLNLQEALSVLLLIHKMRGQIQLPFKNACLMAALKIESNLPPRVRQFCENALKNITARVNAQALAPKEPGLDGVFGTIQSAITQRRKVAIRYDSLFDGHVIESELSPYHLFYNQRAWYIAGHSSVHKEVRTFKLNRIKDAKSLDDPFEGGENFDIGEYIGAAWSMIPEGRVYNVRLKFTPKVANNVAEVHWHDSQTVHRNDDGSATLEFRVDGLNEITWWILGYGDHVEVLSPQQLRSRIAEIAANMIKLNSSE